MGAQRSDRLWLLGGIFAIVAIVAAAYLLAIKPVYTKKSEFQTATDDSKITQISLRKQLAKLDNDYQNRAAHTADMTAMQGHLPSNYDMPNLVRALHISDKGTGVYVSAISVGAPEKVDTVSAVVGVPITLTVAGNPANMSKFLNRIQAVNSRAVLINSINQDSTSASILLDVFCSKGKACTTAQS